MTFKPGETAPNFTLPDENGEMHSLSDYRGKRVVLYFYPEDDTPGCTKEACNFRDDYSQYKKAGFEVLGVSPDSPESHQDFKAKFELPFTLLADEEHQVAELYGVWREKVMFGNHYWGVHRSTFLIDEESKIIKSILKVPVDEHSSDLLELMDQL